MEISEQYRCQVLSHVETIKDSGKAAVVFGAGRAGWYIMKVLEHYQVPIVAFCDNATEKQTTYCNYPVLSSRDIAALFPKARLFIGVFIPQTAAAIEQQFHELGVQDVCFDTASFLFEFLVEVAGRKCDQRVLAESIRILFLSYREGAIHYGYTRDNYFVSPFVTGVITQKCSLRCRDCAQFIPYYRKPVHFSAEEVVADLKRYAQAFDVVPEISLHGGEPFLHPDLQQICREVAAIPNIVFVSFVTNGTVMPAEDALREMAACGADVHQSGGYGELSRCQGALTEAFQRYGIYSDILYCSTTEMWLQPPPFKQHFRSKEVNSEMYQKCVTSKICCQVMSGELHRCSLSMHGMHQGLLPQCEGDFVRLHEPRQSQEALTSRIREFLSRNRAISTCDYCDPDGGTLVPPAVQL